MKTAQLFTLLTLGATLILAPGSERLAHADKDSHPVFTEHPGKHKGWDKHDKRHAKDNKNKHKHWDKHERRHDRSAHGKREHLHHRYANADHQRHHAHNISSRTADGYWHHHDGYPRHFHYSRRHAPVPPHQHGRRVVNAPVHYNQRIRPALAKDTTAIDSKRKEINYGREQLRKQQSELKNDRAELRRDIRAGASKDEIAKDRQEIRDDRASMRKTREELSNDRTDLSAARRGK